MALMPYGSDWREHRKMFHQYFEPNAIGQYEEVTQQEVGACLSRFLETPEDVVGHLRQ